MRLQHLYISSWENLLVFFFRSIKYIFFIGLLYFSILLLDQTGKHSCRRHSWWQSQAHIRPYLDDHLTFPGQWHFIICMHFCVQNLQNSSHIEFFFSCINLYYYLLFQDGKFRNFFSHELSWFCGLWFYFFYICSCWFVKY